MKEKIMRFLRHPIQSVKHPGSLLYPHSWNNEVFIDFLRSRGAKIGKGTRFISPTLCRIDIGRAEYITIGTNCCLSEVHILAHDYSHFVFLEKFDDILPDGGGSCRRK